MLSLRKASVTTKPSVAARSAPVSRRLVCNAVREDVSRREVVNTAIVAMATLMTASPAKAFLGFGDDGAVVEKYNKETASILEKVKAAASLPKDDPTRDDVMKSMKNDINSWVANYRRDPKNSGRPSFGNTYSAVNALAGHYNSFGATTPIPKKRLERLLKEVSDAQNLLARGR